MAPYNGRVVDISNYTGRLTDLDVTHMAAQGVGLVIVRLSLETARNQVAIARQQIMTLVRAHMPWQGYFWCYYDQSPREQLGRMAWTYTDVYDGYLGTTLWLDDEDEETLGPRSYPWLWTAGRTARRLGFSPALYTRRGLWDGSEREGPGDLAPVFARWPLWLADWSSTGDPQPAPVAPFPAVNMVQSPRLGWSVDGLGPHDTNQAYAVS